MPLNCTFSSDEMLILLTTFIHPIYFLYILNISRYFYISSFQDEFGSSSVPCYILDSCRTLTCIKLAFWKKHSFIALASVDCK